MVDFFLDQKKLLTRRSFVLGGIKLSLFSVLMGRLYDLQVLKAARYKTLSEENRISVRLLSPLRGRILDRYGVEMASNRQNYRLVMIPEQSEDPKKTLALLQNLVQLSDKNLDRIEKDLKRHRSFMPITIRDNLNWDEVAKVEVNMYRLSGATIVPGQTRFYPQMDKAAHVVGYVGAVNEKELTGDPLLELPDAKIGKIGLEKTFEESLRGRAGASEVEVNALGRAIRELQRREGVPGKDLHTTIDFELQDFITKRLGEESASVVVMDIHKGDVLALVSHPSFDPNLFNVGIDHQTWQDLQADPKKPITNKAIAGQYAPGSTFKMVTALAALERNMINPHQTVYCSGQIQLGNHKFHCWRKHGHGAVDMEEAISQSCDIYFYELAKKVGIDTIADYANRLGLGHELGIEIPGEKSGLIPTKKWKRKRFNDSWHLGETLIAGIGQGYILTTPLQLAVMTARLANGGYEVKPRLTVSEDPTLDTQPAKLKLSSRNLEMIQSMMDKVVNRQRGTAFSARNADERYHFAGKTGTAQVRRITLAERESGTYSPEKRPWQHRDHALFVGFAPVQNPRYAISVVVEHGLSGSKAAAPIARDTFAFLLEKDEKNAG